MQGTDLIIIKFMHHATARVRNDLLKYALNLWMISLKILNLVLIPIFRFILSNYVVLFRTLIPFEMVMMKLV